MATHIRELLADAQAAEVKGDRAAAAALLRRAAALYRDAHNHTRALKMLRHARRLEGLDEGDESVEGEALVTASPPRTRGRRELEERVPALAPHSLDAWCSFCCRPRTEVGALVAGPAGAFICRTCLGTAARLLGESFERAMAQPSSPAAPTVKGLIDTRAVRRARERLGGRVGRATLLVGPEGAGKSALLAALGQVVRLGPGSGVGRLDRPEGQPLLVELEGALSPELEDELLTLMEEGMRVVLSVRAEPPRPALVLEGPHGDEPLYDTNALVAALGAVVPRQLLAQVDGVVVLPAHDSESLEELAVGLVATRGDVELSEATLKQIAALAHQSGRGAHELVALIARVPTGRWKGKP